MAEDQPFVDYYRILQVDPNCSARTLESAYHFLAKTYHPDHSDEPNVSKLTELIEAYKAIRDPLDRADYDILYQTSTGFIFSTENHDLAEEKSAVSDADLQAKFLMFLYKRRRESAQDAGVGRYFVQQELNCSDEHFEFHLWYLKEKGFIATTEQGTLAITIAGVDHVIAMSRTIVREKLMISQESEPQDRA
jgi:curved DNA-binding protein